MSYNPYGVRDLGEALDSAVPQTYTDLELVVKDDGATADCAQVLC
jgi:glycosyltransferase involved in cell wall biosynthesis